MRTFLASAHSARTRPCSLSRRREVSLDTSRGTVGRQAINNRKMLEKIVISTVSAWELGAKFETTRAQKNEALREAKIAKQDGDLSENAPYQAAKEKFRTMGRIQRRLTKEMNELINQGHIIVNPLSWVTDEPVVAVELGAVIEIEQGGEKQTVLIAGARDHHFPSEGEIIAILRVSRPNQTEIFNMFPALREPAESPGDE